MLKDKDIKAIEDIIERGCDAEVRKRPKTGEILVFEVKKRIKNGK